MVMLHPQTTYCTLKLSEKVERGEVLERLQKSLAIHYCKGGSVESDGI